MDNNKGINGIGLAHLWGKASSEFATKKELQESLAETTPNTQPTDVLWVACEFNFGNGQAEKFSPTYEDIVQAFNDNKSVKLVATYGSTEEPQHAMGDLIHYREDERVLEFAVFVYANILTEEHTLHHFRVVMDSDGNTITDITPIGGGADAVSPTVEVTQIEGGHRVAITDVNETESFDVMNGKDGKPFTFADFTAEQLESLKGKAFTYEDFTEEQLNALKGKAFTYDDFTPEQLEALKGKDGNDYVLTDAESRASASTILYAISNYPHSM